MKKILLCCLLFAILFSCSEDENGDSTPDLDFKEEMREFVIAINDYAAGFISGFITIPQNGIELVTDNGEEEENVHDDYMDAITGHGQEDLFYGYDEDDEATPSNENEYLRVFLDKSKNAGNVILVTDYCYTSSKMDDSYSQNNTAGYISFAADERELNNIPDYPDPIYGENDASITSLSQIKNFLYLINPENYSSKTAFIDAVTATNYDLLIMDLFFHDDTEFTSSGIEQLKNKANGGKRLVICYMSIGEAEDYRYYWQSDWESNKPSWLDEENPDWEGNYKVKYWEKEWQNIIFGNNNSYLKKIIGAGFDGVYLDIIEAYEYYE